MYHQHPHGKSRNLLLPHLRPVRHSSMPLPSPPPLPRIMPKPAMPAEHVEEDPALTYLNTSPIKTPAAVATTTTTNPTPRAHPSRPLHPLPPRPTPPLPPPEAEGLNNNNNNNKTSLLRLPHHLIQPQFLNPKSSSETSVVKKLPPLEHFHLPLLLPLPPQFPKKPKQYISVAIASRPA